MFKNQLTKSVFPAIKSNGSLLDKSERFCRQLKAKDSTFKLPNGSKWADLSIQLDNARPHCKKNKRLMSMIRKAGGRNVIGGVYYGPKVRLFFQPTDSPDLNVLDLGFFSKFWTKIHKILKKNDFVPSLDDIWDAANLAWESITAIEIEVLFRTLEARMMQVIEFNGRNDINIPHEGIREAVEAEDTRLKMLGIVI